MTRGCERCKLPNNRLYQRPDAKYCSSACRQAAYRARTSGPIPRELRTRPRWVNYRADKSPVRVGGGSASSTSPETWSTFDRARAASTRTGFVLNGDGIVCVDLDHCITPNGVLLRRAHELVKLVPGAYVEISPSGDGLHIWGFGRLERGRRLSWQNQQVELYGNGRYMTVTGNEHDTSGGRLVSLQPLLDFVLNQ